MSEQKYYIKGEFTYEQIEAINKSIVEWSNSNAYYDDGEIEGEDDEYFKEKMIKFNDLMDTAKDLKPLASIKVRKNTKQHLLNENEYLLKLYHEKNNENEKLKKEIEELKKKQNVLKLPSVPKK